VTPVEILRRGGFGGDVTGVRAAGAGRRNDVWLVEIGGTELVVRALASADRLAMEVALLPRCAAAGIPVPEVLWSDGDEGTPAMVQRALPGMRLDDLEGLDARSPLASEVARLARAIHAVPVDGGFGSLTSSLTGSAPTLALWFTDPVAAELEAARLSGADHELARAGLDELVAAAPLLDAQPSGLTHGDLQPENILVVGDAVSGILDWEAAKAGPAALDLGWWDWWSEAFEVPWPTEVFIDPGRPEPGVEPGRVRHLVVLRIWLRELLAATRRRDPARAATARLGLRRRLDSPG
jgi:homoserine kinase type II